MSCFGSPNLVLNFDVTASFNELFRDGLVSLNHCHEERRTPILFLKINVAASFNQLLRDRQLSFTAAK